MRHGSRPERKIVSALSPKEKLILDHLGAGLRSRVVAERVGITLKTLYTYCERIRRKLDAHTTAQAITLYMKLKSDVEARRVEAASEGALNP
jgi:DNA-binding CsgD family transcriptional regulator